MERITKGIKWLFRKGDTKEYIRKDEVLRVIDDFDINLYAPGSIVGEELRKKLLKGVIRRLKTRSLVYCENIPEQTRKRPLVTLEELW